MAEMKKRLKPISMHGHNPDDVLAAFLQVKHGEGQPKSIGANPRQRQTKDGTKEGMPKDRKKRFQWEKGDLEIEVEDKESAKEL